MLLKLVRWLDRLQNRVRNRPVEFTVDQIGQSDRKVGFTIATLTFVIFTAKDLYVHLNNTTITDWHQWLEIARIVLKYFMMAVTLIVVAVPKDCL